MRKFKKVLAFALAAAMVVTAAPVSAQAASPSVKLSKTTVYYNGTTTYKTAKATAAKVSGYKVVFTSSNKKVATVSLTKGTVTGKAAGTATITANYKKGTKVVYKKTAKVTVKKAPAATGIKLDKKELNVGETAKISANTSNGAKVNYFSADKSVVTVGKTGGKVTAKAAGKTRIAVKNVITGAKKYLDITVIADAPVATQTGSKVITITNGVEMDASTVKLTKGNSTIATKSIEASADKKSIVITVSSKLTDGTYTVAVGDKTLSVSATTEKVSAVKILSDKAAAVPKTKNGTDYTTATVGYSVTNQFGEDITATTSLKASGTGVNSTVSDGKVVFEATGNNNFIPNRDVVSLVLVHIETGITAQATLTVSDAATISNLTYEGLYNADNKELTENSDPTDYYLLFTAEDQYGSSMIDNAEVGKDLYVTLAGGITNLTATKNKKIITKDGKKYLGVQLDYNDSTPDKDHLSLGAATLTAIAAGSGKAANATVDVAAGNTIDSFSISAPGTIASGEKVELDFTALDRSGNAITDYDALKRLTISGNSDNSTLRIEKTSGNKGKFVFEYTGTIAKDSSATVVYTFTTPTYKVSTVQLTIKEGSKPTKISGVKDGTIAATKGVTKKVTVGDLIVIDNYGRETAAKDIPNLFSGNYGIGIDVSAISSGSITSGAIELSGDAINISNAATATSITGAGVLPKSSNKDTTLFTIKGNTDKLDASIKFYIYDMSTQKKAENTEEVEVPIKIAAMDKISNVKATVGKVYVTKDGSANDKFAQEVKVTGRVNGVDVTLTQGTDYVLTTSDSNLDVTTKAGYVYAKTSLDADNKSFNTKDEITGKLSVVLLTGGSQDVDVALTTVAPTIVDMTIDETDVLFEKDDIIQVKASAVVKTPNGKGDEILVTKIKDSYGVTHTINASDPTVSGVFAPTIKAEVKDIAKTEFKAGVLIITALEAKGKEGTIEITYGGYTKTIRVYQK